MMHDGNGTPNSLGDLPRKDPVPLLHDALNLYCTLHVARRYRRSLPEIQAVRRYLSQLPNVPLDQVSPETIIVWHNTIGEEKPAAANKALGHLRTLYRKMVQWGKYQGFDPTRAVDRFREDPRAVILPDSAVSKVLEALRTRTLPVRLYFLTVMILGYRRDELRCAQWPQLDLATGVFTVPKPKNHRPHRLHFPSRLLALYRRWAQENPGPYLFSDTGTKPWNQARIWRYWDRLRLPLGLLDVTVHDLRRTLISYFCNRDEAGIAQRIANHATRSSTERYHVWGESPIVQQKIAEHAERFLDDEDAQEMNAARMDSLDGSAASGNGNGTVRSGTA